MPEPIGLRERKKRERRHHIEEVALSLFEANGFEATTIDDIAAAADIAARTFFSYFPTKEDVALADYSARLDLIIVEVRRSPPELPVWQVLRAAFSAVASDYEAERTRLIRRFTVMAAAPSVYAQSLRLQAIWERELASELSARTGTPLDDPEPTLLAAAALAAMRSSLEHWISTGHDTRLPSLVQRAFDRLGSGLEQEP